MASERNALRYDTFIATLVGFIALLIAGYTAYEQHQQVRAQVWPLLQLGHSNVPTERLMLANKGVGPAMIRYARVTVDDAPQARWSDVLARFLGPGQHNYVYATMSDAVLSAGEEINVLEPRDADGKPLSSQAPGTMAAQVHAGLNRLGLEICYCSTLGDCWMLSVPTRDPPHTDEVRRCPSPSSTSFKE